MNILHSWANASAGYTAEDNQPCALESLLAEFLGQPVAADAVDFTYYEKKGLVYPAIVFNPSASPAAAVNHWPA